MRVIDPRDVYLFAPSPNPMGPPGTPPAVPHKVNIRRATTAGFACAKHDEIFRLADQRKGDLTSPKRLNLLFYRALLKALHGEMFGEILSDTHIGAAVREHGGTLFSTSRMETFRLASSLLRITTRYPVLNWRISHITRFIPGTPRIACSNAGTWDHHWIDFLNVPARQVDALGAWGITVMPRKGGHIATLHYCSVATDKSVANRQLNRMFTELRTFGELKGVALEEAISSYVIVLAENVCVGTRAWDTYTTQRQELIKKAWMSNSWIPNGGFGDIVVQGISARDISNLNLFR